MYEHIAAPMDNLADEMPLSSIANFLCSGVPALVDRPARYALSPASESGG
jgi:hypothetical protein